MVFSFILPPSSFRRVALALPVSASVVSSAPCRDGGNRLDCCFYRVSPKTNRKARYGDSPTDQVRHGNEIPPLSEVRRQNQLAGGSLQTLPPAAVPAKEVAQGTVPIFAVHGTLPAPSDMSPRKWDRPPRRRHGSCFRGVAEGDRSMLSAPGACAKRPFLPKNGPVPGVVVNALENQDGRRSL